MYQQAMFPRVKPMIRHFFTDEAQMYTLRDKWMQQLWKNWRRIGSGDDWR